MECFSKKQLKIVKLQAQDSRDDTTDITVYKNLYLCFLHTESNRGLPECVPHDTSWPKLAKHLW